MDLKNTKRKINKLFFIFLFAVFFNLLILCIYYFIPGNNPISNIEQLSINARYLSKAVLRAEAVAGTIKFSQGEGIYKKIIIASVDQLTIDQYGSLTLDRKIWADILNHFNSLPKESIPDLFLFDMYFNEPSPDPASDLAFGNALAGYQGVAGEDFTMSPLTDSKEIARNIQDYTSPKIQALKKFELRLNKPVFLPSNEKITAPIPEIADKLGFLGTVNMFAENQIYRKMPMILSARYYLKENNAIRLTNVYYPSVLLASAVKLLKSGLSDIELGKDRIIIKNANYNGKISDFVIPVDESYRMIINYKATRNSGYLKNLSVKDIARAGLPKNSIILAGYFIEGVTVNKWQSPIELMASTYHIAFGLGTIMNRDFIYPVPNWVNIFYTIFLSFIICFMISKGIRTTIIGLILSAALPLLLGFGLFQFRVEIHIMVPMLVSILTLVTGEIYILLTEQKEKRFIKTTFSKYVNPELVNILIQNPDMLELGGQEKDVTLLFSDIRGFTTLSEGMTAQDLISFLNIYLSRMTDIVMETHGTLDKYIGDAVVAFWGTPFELPNHALNACRAAVKMMEALKQFNEEQAKLGKKPINIGVGLNSGTITVGNIGSEKKKNYTAIGDSANLAEDLQDENKTYKTNIIISEYTYERVKDKVLVRELDTIYVKGSVKPIKIYELLDMLSF